MSDPYKGLPRRLRVGYLTFRVVITTHDTTDGHMGEDDFGSCRFEPPTIYLREGTDPQLAFNTVLHEVRHAIHYAQELSDSSSEEDFVTRGTNGEVEFWLANPRFYAWQSRMLRQLRRTDGVD